MISSTRARGAKPSHGTLSAAHALLFCALLSTLIGCGEDIPVRRAGGGGKAAAASKAAETKDDGKGELASFAFQDDDFVESQRRRDPFRTYSIRANLKEEPEELQRRVVMPTTSVDEMRLIAIVTGTPRPKAMLLDTSYVGFVVERGDYLGRPKLVQATGNVSMMVNWRVDRIRENEVVLTQQDPADPSRVALTKIIPLNDEVAAR